MIININVLLRYGNTTKNNVNCDNFNMMINENYYFLRYNMIVDKPPFIIFE